MMTRRCTGRDRLVAAGAGKVARGSCLRGAGQTPSCKTIGHKNRCGGGDFEVAPALGPRRSGAGYSRAGCRGNAVFDTLSSAGTARNYQYELARRAGKMSSGCAANGERPKSRPVPFEERNPKGTTPGSKAWATTHIVFWRIADLLHAHFARGSNSRSYLALLIKDRSRL